MRKVLHQMIYQADGHFTIGDTDVDVHAESRFLISQPRLPLADALVTWIG